MLKSHFHLIAVCLVIAAYALTFVLTFLPLTILLTSRLFLGLLLIFFFVGNSIIVLLKNHLNTIDLLEEVGLSIGLSLTILIIITSLLGTYYFVSTFSLFLLLSAISLVATILAIAYDHKLGFQKKLDRTNAIKNPPHKLSKSTIVLGGLIASLISFSFFILLALTNSTNGLFYSFSTNSSIIDLLILVTAITILFFLLKTTRLSTTGFLAALLTLLATTFLLAAKTGSYPSLISYGLGYRIGIDTWDSLGHLIGFLNTGHYVYGEPFLFFFSQSQIITVPNPFPAGYFSMMGGLSMILSLGPLFLTRSIFFFRLLQTFFIFLVARKITNDPIKGLLAALFISGGTLESEIVKFTSGALSPIATVGLALIPFGIYLMTLKRNKVTNFLVILVAISLLYIHFASAILYVFIMLVYYYRVFSIHQISNFKHITLQKIKIKKIGTTLLLIATALTILIPIVLFWFGVYTDPNAQLSIHYSERFHFLQPGNQNLSWFLLNNALFIVLIGYGIISYMFQPYPRKERSFLLTWAFTLLAVYIFLFFVNQLIAYRIVAYLYQPACVIGACAFVHDIFEKPSGTNRKRLKKIWAFTLLFLAIFASFAPSFLRDSSPDAFYLERTPLERNYYNLALWAQANFSATGVIVVNNYTTISDPVNLLRDMGVTMLVGQNLTSTDYIQISSIYGNALALDAPDHLMAINHTSIQPTYIDQLENGENISLYNLTKTLSAQT
jgi:hypothetical protein